MRMRLKTGIPRSLIDMGSFRNRDRSRDLMDSTDPGPGLGLGSTLMRSRNWVLVSVPRE